MTKLKNCPFCGGEAKIHSRITAGFPHVKRAYVFCSKCISTGEQFDDLNGNGEYVLKAAKAWNRRVDLDD